ncbi:MAG: hypothetical protein Q3982_08635 [Phoenicibacter congonensis]|uniref:Uncharacterized protein n=1 Tax=Phoenicibacter congonensis TaxID=1944646 RepID=A0AA43RJ28_9ACTN|nr:hypothetical protein [Phoenicibacter congonensis]
MERNFKWHQRALEKPEVCNCGIQWEGSKSLGRNPGTNGSALAKNQSLGFLSMSKKRFSRRKAESRSRRFLNLQMLKKRFLRRKVEPLPRKLESQAGQSTVEFAIVAAILIVVVVAFIAIFHRLDDGTFLQHAQTASSHNITSSVSGAIDAFSY